MAEALTIGVVVICIIITIGLLLSDPWGNS